jgi:hypothetical protein
VGLHTCRPPAFLMASTFFSDLASVPGEHAVSNLCVSLSLTCFLFSPDPSSVSCSMANNASLPPPPPPPPPPPFQATSLSASLPNHPNTHLPPRTFHSHHNVPKAPAAAHACIDFAVRSSSSRYVGCDKETERGGGPQLESERNADIEGRIWEEDFKQKLHSRPSSHPSRPGVIWLDAPLLYHLH